MKIDDQILGEGGLKLKGSLGGDVPPRPVIPFPVCNKNIVHFASPFKANIDCIL